MEALPWASPTMLAHKICPGAGGSKDLADSLGIASQGAERHVPMLGRQYHLLDVGHLDGRELARAGSRARGAIVQTADRRGGAVPSVVSPGFEMRDTQDHGEGEEWFCTGGGTQDSGFGAAFREPLASECEAGSAEHRQENSDNGREDAHSAIKLCDGVHQLLSVLVERFDGDDRALTTSSPGGNSGARDPDVLGQASGTGPDHLKSLCVANKLKDSSRTLRVSASISACLSAARTRCRVEPTAVLAGIFRVIRLW